MRVRLDVTSADCVCSQTIGYQCVCARTPTAKVCGACPEGTAKALTSGAQRNIGKGNWGEAELQIRCALQTDPSYTRAQNIRTQLNRRRSDIALDIDDRSTVPYRVLPGDQLGDIAQKCLGDADKFVDIAVLNNIANPSRLRAGTQLRLPTTRPCVNCEELREAALRSEIQDDLADAVNKITFAKEVCRGNELIADDHLRLRDLRITALHSQAEKFLEDGATGQAKANWQQILELEPTDKKAIFYLDSLQDDQ